MLDQLDTADSDYDVACRWLQSNEEIWTDWLPEKGKCFSQFGIYDAPRPPNLWRWAFLSAWHWCMRIWFVYAFMRPYPRHALMNARMQNGEIYNTQQYTRAHDTSIYIYTYMLAWMFLAALANIDRGDRRKVLADSWGQYDLQGLSLRRGPPNRSQIRVDLDIFG